MLAIWVLEGKGLLKGKKMTNKVKVLAARTAAILAAPALGLALTAVPAQAAMDTNLSDFGQEGIGSATSGNAIGGQQIAPLSKTIGNQSVSTAAAASKDAMPDNPSQKLPDKVSAAVPDDATVVSKNLAVTTDGQVKNLQTGKPVTDPKLVGTQDQQPDPLAKTGGKRFIPVEASEVKQAVQKNGGDANATDSGSSNGSSSSKVSGASDVEVASKSTSGTVRNVALQNNQYGAFWGWWNNTPAFFERGGNLFAQQAKGVVDVSEHQGVIDWQAAKNSGVEGAIIRIGFGWGNRFDYQALRNINECKRLGIPFGIYLYSYAYDNNSAWAEGVDTVNKLRAAGVSPGDLSYPVFYDLENWTWTGHTPPTNPWVYDGIVKTWYNALIPSGYNSVSVYSYTFYLNTALNTPDVRNNTRWVASYGSRTNFPYASNDRGWQYADNGWINGIGNVDLNAFGNYNYSATGMGQPAVPQIANYRMVGLPTDTYFVSPSARDSSGLDIPSGSTESGISPQIWSANGSRAQQYKFIWHPADNDYARGSYEIQNVASGKVLDVPAGIAYSGARIQQYDANNTLAQRWYLRDTGNGGMYIQSALNNLVIDLSGANTSNGTKFRLWSPNLSQAQQFIFSTVSTVSPGLRRIRSFANGGIVFDVPAASRDDGIGLQVHDWNDTNAQKYNFRQVGNGIYEILNANSGKAVDLSGANSANGVKVDQYAANGTCAQHWAVRELGSGQYALYTSCAADKAVDIPAGQAVNDQRLQIYAGNGTNAQRWFVEPVRTQRQIIDELAAAHRRDLQDGTYIIAAGSDHSMVLDVEGAASWDGARVQLFSNNGTGAQRWRVSHDGAGYITFTNVVSGKVLDISGAQDIPGVSMQQFSSNGTYAQKWIAVPDGNTLKLVSALDSSIVLDIAGNGMFNGNTVHTYTDNGTAAQRWVAARQ